MEHNNPTVAFMTTMIHADVRQNVMIIYPLDEDNDRSFEPLGRVDDNCLIQHVQNTYMYMPTSKQLMIG